MSEREGRRDEPSSQAALPEPELLTLQAAWLAPARSYLLRQVQIARRQRVLDLGTGYGVVLPELQRRAGGSVIALDREMAPLRYVRGSPPVAADATALPFCDGTFDLIFSQISLLWITPLAKAIAEISRTLRPGGVLVALEPDYGGMIEHPPEVHTRAMWLSALARAGADPYVARKLPRLLSAQGFAVDVGLFNTLGEADPARFDFLAGLPLTAAERDRLAAIRAASRALQGAWAEVAHLPFFLVRAEKLNPPPPRQPGARRRGRPGAIVWRPRAWHRRARGW
ncbi:MAG: methyltransferase domain-containing protein [Anaerolineae bacterium]|nr:methyltransferase domain-containing protein [Anaerolineae bacterium]